MKALQIEAGTDRSDHIAVALHPFELEALANEHDRLAGDALRAGEHELHDRHECRAHQLRRFNSKRHAGSGQ